MKPRITTDSSYGGEDSVMTVAVVGGDDPAGLTAGVPNLWKLLDHSEKGRAAAGNFDTSAYKLSKECAKRGMNVAVAAVAPPRAA